MKLFGVFALSLLILSCGDLLSTREAENPDDDASRSLWVQPTSPEILLQNLSSAFRERNVENYMRTLTDSSTSGRTFVFLPDQESEISNPGVFDTWGLDEERRYITLIFSGDISEASASLMFEHFTEPAIPADTAEFEEIYDLDINLNLENVPQKMAGIAQFRMARDQGGNWSIYFWKDLTYVVGDNTTPLPTWSELKARAR